MDKSFIPFTEQLQDDGIDRIRATTITSDWVMYPLLLATITLGMFCTFLGGLVDDDAEARTRQLDRAGEAVRAGADDHGMLHQKSIVGTRASASRQLRR